jgi:type IV secretory pathway VirB4 component
MRKILLALVVIVSLIATPYPRPAQAIERENCSTITQIETIRSAVPKRHYYVVSPEGYRLIDLQLGPLALTYVVVGLKEDIARVNALCAKFGDEWPHVWLREQGVQA